MRLINCATLKFEEFFGKNIPPYAILSHTWETYEISYKEYDSLGDLRLKPGPQAEKIVKTCDVAIQNGYHYVCRSTLNRQHSALSQEGSWSVLLFDLGLPTYMVTVDRVLTPHRD